MKRSPGKGQQQQHLVAYARLSELQDAQQFMLRQHHVLR
jgi:hypothetical protein